MNAIASSRAALARRRARAHFDHGAPIRRIDSLPILLFLCAIVSTFLAISRPPPQALVIDLPAPVLPGSAPAPARDLLILRVGVDLDGTPTFNAVRVSARELAALLSVASHLEWKPGVIFEPHPKARYEDALPVLGEISKAGLADWRFCLGGLASHRQFGKDWRSTPLRLTMLPPPQMPAPVERSPLPGDCDPRKQLPPAFTD